MSSFAGTDYFGSGPHTFAVGPRGQQWASKIDLGLTDAGIEVLGNHTLTVEVRGVLVAADAAALGVITDALEGVSGGKGDLTDASGRTWPGVTLIEVRYDGPPQVGRQWSIGYRVLFVEV